MTSSENTNNDNQRNYIADNKEFDNNDSLK